MSLVRFTGVDGDVFVNPDHVTAIRPDSPPMQPMTLGESGAWGFRAFNVDAGGVRIDLSGGGSVFVFGQVANVASALGCPGPKLSREAGEVRFGFAEARPEVS